MFIRERVRQLFVLSIGAGVLTASVLGCIAFANSLNVGALSAIVEKNVTNIEKNASDIKNSDSKIATVNAKADSNTKGIKETDEKVKELYEKEDKLRSSISRGFSDVTEQLKKHSLRIFGTEQATQNIVQRFEHLNNKVNALMITLAEGEAIKKSAKELQDVANTLLIQVDLIKANLIEANGLYEAAISMLGQLRKIPGFYDRESVINHLENTINPIINNIRSILKERFPEDYEEKFPQG